MHWPHRTLRLGFLALVTLVGCRRTDEPPARPPLPSTATTTGDEVGGTVVETMDSGGYTYAKLDRGTGAVWVAGPATPLAVGRVIGPVRGTLMTDFRSGTLERTFARIYFIPAYPITGSAPPNPHRGPAGSTATAPGGDPPIEAIAPLPGGQTVAAVFASSDTLAGKPVMVRGRVVKVNNGILGRNWLHLQDGSGAPGTNDLTVTYATGTVVVGDVVVARGTVAIDQDFGAGYKYALIVENATIAAQ